MNAGDNIGGPMTDAHLNAQPETQLATETQPDLDALADECMKGFERLDAADTVARDHVGRIKIGQDDQSRLRYAIIAIEALQKRNELSYSLLVSMNNFFGSK